MANPKNKLNEATSSPLDQAGFRDDRVRRLGRLARGERYAAFWRSCVGYVRADAQRYQDTVQLLVAMGGGWWDRKLIRGRRWQSGPAMISSQVPRRPPSNTDAGLMTRMTVVSMRSNGAGDASRHLVRRTDARARLHYLFIFLPFRDSWHDALHHLDRLPTKRLRRVSVAAKPAAGMLIRGRALTR
jgi:hypothetical protein